jgi:hypothetical protein
MGLDRLLNGDYFRWLPRIQRTSPRFAQRAPKVVPVICCIPGSEIWSLRLAVAFLAHLAQGGHITDRLGNRVVGRSAGSPFNFDHIRGGPLLWVPRLVGTGHVFIGYTVCPGFSRVAAEFPWWQGTRFCTPGYDYFHDGLNYAHVPVDMAPHAYVPVSVSGLDAAAWTQPAQRAVLLYPDPVEQAVIYFHRCRSHSARAYNTLGGRRVADWTFRDFFFQHALPSYAKIFISYQAMASRMPGSVSLVPYGRMVEHPAETLASVLSHLTATRRDWPMIEDAVALARREHLTAVETELGRSLDRRRRSSRGRDVRAEEAFPKDLDPGLRREGLAFLESLGIDIRHFESSRGVAPNSGMNAA